jgi:hypothetical protein
MLSRNSAPLTTTKRTTLTPPSSSEAASSILCRVIYSFKPPQHSGNDNHDADDDWLALKRGQRVAIAQHLPGGWSRGYKISHDQIDSSTIITDEDTTNNNDDNNKQQQQQQQPKMGLFPTAFVRAAELELLANATHDFDSTKTSQLSFRAGDTLVLLSRIPGYDW